MTDEIAEDLLAKFVTWKKIVQRYYQPSDKDKKQCEKAAELCVEHAIDPHMYFLAQIDGITELDKIEKYRVARFADKWAVGKAKDYVAKTTTPIPEPADIFAHCGHNVQRIMQIHEDPILMLLSTKYDFPAWFRIISTRTPNQGVIDKFREAALMELKADPRIEPFIKSLTIASHLERITNAG